MPRKNTQPRNKTAQKTSSVLGDIQKKASASKVTSQDKKYRMTADGKLKEKRGFSIKSKEGKRKSGYFKKG